MRSRTTALGLSLVTAIALTGCGTDDTPSGSGDAASDPTPTAKAHLHLARAGHRLSSPPPPTCRSCPLSEDRRRQGHPERQSNRLEAGKSLTITFTTDRAGELHVHSKPEQFVKFPTGTSTKKLTIKVPGVVEVEEHDTSHVVAQSELR